MALTFLCLQGSEQCLAHSWEVLYTYLEEEQRYLFLRYFPGVLITTDLDLFWISIFFVASAIPSALDYGQLCVAEAGLLDQI